MARETILRFLHRRTDSKEQGEEMICKCGHTDCFERAILDWFVNSQGQTVIRFKLIGASGKMIHDDMFVLEGKR